MRPLAGNCGRLVGRPMAGLGGAAGHAKPNQYEQEQDRARSNRDSQQKIEHNAVQTHGHSMKLQSALCDITGRLIPSGAGSSTPMGRQNGGRTVLGVRPIPR